MRISPVRQVGDAPVRHVAHTARFVGLLALRAIGGTLVDADVLLLRDLDPVRSAQISQIHF